MARGLVQGGEIEVMSSLAAPPLHRSVPCGKKTLVLDLPGTDLNRTDIEALARSGIDQHLAERALLRRVDTFTGASIIGRDDSRHYEGIVFPYVWPGEQHVREYRLRRDRPEYQSGKPKNKYLSPPGRGNMLYFVPGTPVEWLSDSSLPIVLTEGEKKGLALFELSWRARGDAAEKPAWLTMAIPGVSNWYGKIGRVGGPNGESLDETGPIPDLNRVTWPDRKVTIAFDSNVHSNDGVRIARLTIAKHLRSRGARILFLDIPPSADVNGIDDLIGLWGSQPVLALLESESYDPLEKAAAAPAWPEPLSLQAEQLDRLSCHILPGLLGQYCQALANFTETPPELSMLAALGVVSCAVAGKIEIEAEPGYVEPANLYLCPILESGSRKTAVVNHVLAPLLAFEAREKKKLAPTIECLKSERRTREVVIEKLRKKLTTMDESAIREIQELESSLPEVPAYPTLFTSDVTPEKLEGLLGENAERMAVISDEGGIFDVIVGRYSPVPNLDIWLKGHSGAAHRTHRMGRGSLLDKPLLSVMVSPQPGVLAGLHDKPFLRDRGLLARFLYALPESPIGRRQLSLCSMPAVTTAQYEILLTRLLEWRPSAVTSLRLAPDAYPKWKHFQREVETLMSEGGRLCRLRDWGSKLQGAPLRMAGLLHVLRYSDALFTLPEEVGEPETATAITICSALISHARAVFQLVTEDPQLTKAKRLMKWLLSRGVNQVTSRECFRAHQPHVFEKRGAMDACLKLLADHFMIRLVSRETGGRPSEWIEINPDLLGGSVHSVP